MLRHVPLPDTSLSNFTALRASPPREPPTRNARRYAPLAILAPPRSYSSVVTSMIGEHPELYAFPELNLFRGETLKCSLTFSPGGGVVQQAGLFRAVAQIRDSEQTAASVRRAKLWLEARLHWHVEHVYDWLLAEIEPQMGVEKSPPTAATSESLARVRRFYPRARFLHLVRHPVTAIRSMHAHWTGLDWLCPQERLTEFAAEAWYAIHRRIMLFGMKLPPAQVLRVRGEDVLERPTETLGVVADWLGIRSDQAVIDSMCHPERSPYANFGPPGAAGGNDPNFLCDPTLRSATYPPTTELPCEWKIPSDLELVIRRLAEHFGYGDV